MGYGAGGDDREQLAGRAGAVATRRGSAAVRRRRWTAEQIPPLGGRLFVVTGATSGLGLATTRALAAHGARVVLAVRDEQKGRRIADEDPAALLVRRVDLSDFGSVRAFAAGLHDEFGGIDVLINNAG